MAKGQEIVDDRHEHVAVGEVASAGCDKTPKTGLGQNGTVLEAEGQLFGIAKDLAREASRPVEPLFERGVRRRHDWIGQTVFSGIMGTFDGQSVLTAPHRRRVKHQALRGWRRRGPRLQARLPLRSEVSPPDIQFEGLSGVVDVERHQHIDPVRVRVQVFGNTPTERSLDAGVAHRPQPQAPHAAVVHARHENLIDPARRATVPACGQPGKQGAFSLRRLTAHRGTHRGFGSDLTWLDRDGTTMATRWHKTHASCDATPSRHQTDPTLHGGS
jgi:hypothetical protein